MGSLKELKQKLPSIINDILFQTLNKISKLISNELSVKEEDIKIHFDETRIESKLIFPYEGVNISLTIIPQSFIFGEEDD
jgi:hypothetical protein